MVSIGMEVACQHYYTPHSTLDSLCTVPHTNCLNLTCVMDQCLQKTPWLIATFHAPWYHSYSTHYKEVRKES